MNRQDQHRQQKEKQREQKKKDDKAYDAAAEKRRLPVNSMTLLIAGFALVTLIVSAWMFLIW